MAYRWIVQYWTYEQALELPFGLPKDTPYGRLGSGVAPHYLYPMDRIRVERVKGHRAWRLVDTKGRLHSADIADRARCQRQADAMNARLARLGKLAPES